MSYQQEDNITTLLTAQRVQLYVSTSTAAVKKGGGYTPATKSDITTTTGNNQKGSRLATMRGLSVNMAHPRRRINHGLSRMYVHAAPDIMMSFVISGDTQVLTFIQARAVRTTGVLPRYTWMVRVTDEAGKTSDKRFVAQLESVSMEKPIESQDDPYDITCDLIVMDQTLSTNAFE